MTRWNSFDRAVSIQDVDDSLRTMGEAKLTNSGDVSLRNGEGLDGKGEVVKNTLKWSGLGSDVQGDYNRRSNSFANSVVEIVTN